MKTITTLKITQGTSNYTHVIMMAMTVLKDTTKDGQLVVSPINASKKQRNNNAL